MYENMFIYLYDRMKQQENSIQRLEKAALILKTVAHPARLAIIDLLKRHQELTVSEIIQAIELEQSLTSHHLTNMKVRGILGSKRVGKQIFYYLKERDVAKVIDCIEHCKPNF